MFIAILAMHAVDWLTLRLVVVPAHHSVVDKVLDMGVEMTAYALGMRRASDADHIAPLIVGSVELLGCRPCSSAGPVASGTG